MTDCAHTWTDVAQAWGAILAIAAGFGYVSFERWAEAEGAADAAALLARHSINRVTERIEALIDPAKPKELALRGAQASEMIEVMRELEISTLPSRIVEPIATIRSAVFAINVRIDEILLDDHRRRDERRERLYSSGRVLATARDEMDRLVTCFPWWKIDRRAFRLTEPSTEISRFLVEAATMVQSGTSAAKDERQRRQ